MFRDRGMSESIPHIVWGAVIAAYMCLCGISVVHIAKRNTRYLVGIDFLAQGILVSAVAVHLGAGLISWLALILLLIGLMSIFLNSTRAPSDDYALPSPAAHPAENISLEQMLSKFGLAICYADENGAIEEATEMFIEAVDKRPDELIGENASHIIQDSDGEVALPSGKWWLHIVTDGTRKYYHLMPTANGRPAKDEPKSAKRAPGDIAFIDTESGLYTTEYRDVRGPEEVLRAQRYKRPLSSILLELAFDSQASLQLSSDQIHMLKMAFVQKVKEVLRETDSCFWMEDHERLLILLPETQQQGAKSLISRLQMLPQEVYDEDIRNAIGPRVTAGLYYCNGSGQTTMDFGVFLASIEQAFAAAKEA